MHKVLENLVGEEFELQSWQHIVIISKKKKKNSPIYKCFRFNKFALYDNNVNVTIFLTFFLFNDC